MAKFPKQEIILPPTTPTRYAWERMSEDDAGIFHYFALYRDAGVDSMRPSLNAFAEEHGINPPTIYSWSSVYKWKERLDAFDKHIDALRLEQLEKEISRVRLKIYKETEAMFDEFHKTRQAMVAHLKDSAHVVAAQLAMDEGIPEFHVAVIFDASTLKTMTDTHAVLSRELRTALGLPSTISSSTIKGKVDMGLEDWIKNRIEAGDDADH